MREIKFRAWDKRYGEMEHTHDLYISGQGDEALSADIHDRYVFMQYTGLKDKNGVEIYEGDLLDIKSAGGDRGYVPVVFRDASFMMHIPYWVNDYYHLSDYDSDLYEAIGNIWEHGHLLENESKTRSN